jgi:hypothetical protein
MKKKLFTSIFIYANVAIVLALPLSMTRPAHASETEFYCGSIKGVPVTYARTADGKKKALIRWQSKDFGKWNAQKRCVEISRRFQRNYEQGTLGSLASGVIRGQRVICAVNSLSELCNDRNVLFALKRGSNPDLVMQQLMDKGSLATASVINQSSNSINIDLDRYLNALPVAPD